jgi:hypothetical protein
MTFGKGPAGPTGPDARLELAAVKRTKASVYTGCPVHKALICERHHGKAAGC